MKTVKVTFAENLNDALDLAAAWLTELNVNDIIEHADMHIEEIAHFNPNHTMIHQIKSLSLLAQELRNEINTVVKPLGWG